MKKLIFLFLIIPALIFSQELKRDEVDEFTGKVVKETSWKTLNATKFYSYFSVKRIDTLYYISLKLMLNKVFSIDKDALFMLKMADDSIIKLKNLKYSITCIGCGSISLMGSSSPGLEVTYFIPKKDVDKILKTKIIKIRIYTNDGYIEVNMKEKHYLRIKRALELVQ